MPQSRTQKLVFTTMMVVVMCSYSFVNPSTDNRLHDFLT